MEHEEISATSSECLCLLQFEFQIEMNLPSSVYDAVIEDFTQHLSRSNQQKNVEKRLAMLTGHDKVASRSLSELETFVSDHLSSDLSTADAEMDLFLARKRLIERAIPYFQNKIVAEELVEQCRVLYEEDQTTTLNLMQASVSFLLQETNTCVSGLNLTKQLSESLKQGVVNTTGTLREKLEDLLLIRTPQDDKGKSLQKPENIEQRIKENLATYQSTRTHSSRTFLKSLYILAGIVRELNKLLTKWDKDAISCGDSMILKIRKLCIQVEICFNKLRLLQGKLLKETYNPTSQKKLNENKQYLCSKYKKLLSERDRIQSTLQKYLQNRNDMKSIALEYRKTVETIREREAEIKYLLRLSTSSHP